MAYMETSPSRLGSNNLGADANELFLKQFAGEVLTVFETDNVMMPLHTVRSISSGKSAQFPVTGVASATYHTAGESLLVTDNAGGGASKYLSRLRHSEIVINIDDMLVSSAFISNIDEAKNHYDVRSIYSTEIGRQLAYVADRNLIRTVIAGAVQGTDRFGTARATSVAYLGETIEYDDEPATTANQGNAIVSALFTAAQKMDEKNVPSTDRYCILSPQLYYQIVGQNQDAISRDYSPEGGASKQGGYIMQVAGIRILKSNHIPSTNEASAAVAPHNNAGVMNDIYGGSGTGYGAFDFSRGKGIIFQKEAVGTVKLLDLAVESDYVIDRQGTLMVAKYAMGHGVLRSECCYWLRGDA